MRIGIKQLSYDCVVKRISDHRPVSSIFSIEIKTFDQCKLQRSLNVNYAAVPPEVFIDVKEGEILY